MNKPLTDIWDEYTFSLSSSIENEELNDDSVTEVYVWPRDLKLSDEEKEDIKRFVHERLQEILQRHSNLQLDNAIVASYIFRSVLSGMMFAMQKSANA